MMKSLIFHKKNKRHPRISGGLFFSFFLFLIFQNAHTAVQIPFSHPQKISFTYEVVIEGSSDPKKLALWVPYPTEDHAQKVLSFQSHSLWPVKITKEKKYGNKMIYIEGKAQKSPVTLKFKYEILRSPDTGGKLKTPGNAPKLYQKPDKLVPIFPQIREIASQETKNVKTPYQKIKKLYHYIVKTMRYDKSGTGWGEGNAVWACSTKRGNCTDFHSLFIALNRSEKIPAKFEIGFPIPTNQKEGEIPGYHCWAKAYDPKQGWIPVDATEAKKTGEIEKYFGRLPSNRVQFSQGRDLVLNPKQKGEALNYFIYPYAEMDGKKFTHLKTKFYFKSL